jgi:hypothetical protein
MTFYIDKVLKVLPKGVVVPERPTKGDYWNAPEYMSFKDGEGWISFSQRMNPHFTIQRKPIK